VKYPPAEQLPALAHDTDVTCESVAVSGISATDVAVCHTPLTCETTNAVSIPLAVWYPPTEQLPSLTHDTEFTNFQVLEVSPGTEKERTICSIGVTDTAAEDSPLPVAFTARSVTLYLVMAVSPVIDTVEDVPPLETSAQVLPALVEY
jgi:hypothetical protein